VRWGHKATGLVSLLHERIGLMSSLEAGYAMRDIKDSRVAERERATRFFYWLNIKKFSKVFSTFLKK
jgi:hypothetical protein